MKKLGKLLLIAGLMTSFAACKNGGGQEPEPTPDKFTSKVKVTPTDVTASVEVEVSKDDVEYKLWVVKEADYAEAVPADAKTCKGNVTEEFTGLTPNTDYYAVVYEETAGYKTYSFLTDKEVKAFDCLKGSNYYVSVMDEYTIKSIESKIVANLSVNDRWMFLYVWDNTMGGGACSGPNYYGEVVDWVSLTIPAGGTWFGCGFCLTTPEAGGDAEITEEEAAAAKAARASLADITADYTVHIAMKSTSTGKYNMSVLGGAIAIGTENDAYGFVRDGAWHEIEIPMSEFMKSESFSVNDANVFAFTQADGVFPTNLDVDALFIYKK